MSRWTGNLHGKKKTYKIDKKDKIDKITIQICFDNGELKKVTKYKFKNHTEFLERSLFATEKEAIAACERLNVFDDNGQN